MPLQSNTEIQYRNKHDRSSGHCKAYQITYPDMCSCASVSKLIYRSNGFQGNPDISVSIFEFFNRFVRLPTVQSCWGHTSPQEYIQAFKSSFHSIVYEANLPHLVCRPCERRLNNSRDSQKVILETEQHFTKVKPGSNAVSMFHYLFASRQDLASLHLPRNLRGLQQEHYCRSILVKNLDRISKR